MILTDEQLAELERLEGQATEGEWISAHYVGIGGSYGDVCIHLKNCEYLNIAETPAPSNAKFIATTRNLLPSLLADYREMQGRIGELEAENAKEKSGRVSAFMQVDFADSALTLVMEERDALKAALTELVTLKAQTKDLDTGDYEERTMWAWEAARKALSTGRETI